MFRFYAYTNIIRENIEGSVNKHFTQFNQEMSVYLPTNHQLLPVTCYSYTYLRYGSFYVPNSILYIRLDCMRTKFKFVF